MPAEKLVRVGPEAKRAYGIEAYGLSKSSEAKIRAATADACGQPGAQGCPITTIACAHARHGGGPVHGRGVSVYWVVD